MPLLFSYGTLQQESVQRSTFGRLLNGHRDELVGFEQSLFEVKDPEFVAKSGKAHHAILRYTGRPSHRVPGAVFEISDSELAAADSYEPAGYARVMAMLASGGHAWVYTAVDATPCVFCDIVAGRGPASVIYEDDSIMAFMTIRPFAAGECTVIPRAHIDHFTEVPDDLAQRIMVAAQRIGRRMRDVFKPERVGMVVHGYGVAHAHLILVPQNDPYDITSARYAHLDDGRIHFSMKNIPPIPRATLDEHARLLRDSGER